MTTFELDPYFMFINGLLLGGIIVLTVFYTWYSRQIKRGRVIEK